MSFQCPCSWQNSTEEYAILQHIEQCRQFNAESPLCQFMSRADFDRLGASELLMLKYDLQLQLKRIDTQLNIKQPPLLNFDFYTRIAIQNSNIQQSVVQTGRVQPQMELEVPKKPATPTVVSPVRTMVAEEIQPNTQKMACEQCRKLMSEQEDFDKIWYLETCLHLVCKPCIVQLAEKYYVFKEGKILCPELGCGERITTRDLENVLGNRYAELDHKLAMKSQNLAECQKCKLQFSFDKGNIKEQIKDNSGKIITGHELDHYINNRFKCPACTTEQCKSCGVTPYHLNQTCESFKKHQASKKCRLCESPCNGDNNKPEALQFICTSEDCQRRSMILCTTRLPCGHWCNGVKGEDCICLNEKCSKQSGDEYCTLCYTEALKSAPCVKSKCGHIFHEECIMKKLQSKWNGPRIVFKYTECSLCNAKLDVKNKLIKELLNKASELEQNVQALCIERLDIENMQNAKELKDPKHQFYKKPAEFSMHVFCFYECFKCKKPFFGGMKNCQAAAEQDQRREFNKEDLICPECNPVSFEHKCNKHGVKYIEFKCRFCCSLALWFCGGSTHYCEPCHNGSNALMNKPCPGLPKCPLGVKHKPNGEECALGCALCRAKRMDDIKKQAEQK